MQSGCPLGLLLPVTTSTYYVQMKENLHYLFSLEKRGTQSWSKSGNFMIFAFYTIFNF